MLSYSFFLSFSLWWKQAEVKIDFLYPADLGSALRSMSSDTCLIQLLSSFKLSVFLPYHREQAQQPCWELSHCTHNIILWQLCRVGGAITQGALGLFWGCLGCGWFVWVTFDWVFGKCMCCSLLLWRSLFNKVSPSYLLRFSVKLLL